MRKNILFGIGGTGSRIVEAILPLLAAGLGPEDGVHIGLMDQDGHNGNAGRTKLLFDALAATQTDIGTEPGRFPGSRILSFRDDQFLEQTNINWKPDLDDKSLVALLNIKNEDPDHRALFAHLFDEEEASKELKVGFEGHANVGAAAIYSALMESADSFNQRLTYFIQQTNNNAEVRLFFAGSIFGGMGASGFPTLARRIKRMQGDVRNEKIRVGGVLMLPYFTFKDDNDDKFALKAGEILMNSRQSLEFYSDFLRDQPDVFDQIYIAGWNDLFELDYWSKGGAGQKNPPMAPELYAAAAAIDFFSRDTETLPIRNQPDTLPIQVSGRADGGALIWADIPGREAIESALGRLLRLAIYWRYSLDPALRSKTPVPAEWQYLAGEGLNLDVLDRLTNARQDGLFDLLLKWAGGMEIFAGSDQNLTFSPWIVSCAKGDLSKPHKDIELIEGCAVDTLFDEAFADAARDACDLYHEICEAGAHASATPPGIELLVKSVDRAARLRPAD